MQIVEVFRPEIYYYIMRMYASEVMIKSTVESIIPISSINLTSLGHHKIISTNAE